MNIKLPQNLKYKKYCKSFIYSRGSFFKSRFLFVKSQCGLVALEEGVFTIPQLQTCMVLINKTIKLKKKYRQKILCSIIIRAPLTEKSLGSRMGRGKGSISRWVCPIRKGRMLFQFKNLKNIRQAVIALKKISYKLPFLTKIVLKRSLFLKRILKETND